MYGSTTSITTTQQVTISAPPPTGYVLITKDVEPPARDPPSHSTVALILFCVGLILMFLPFTSFIGFLIHVVNALLLIKERTVGGFCSLAATLFYVFLIVAGIGIYGILMLVASAPSK